MNRYGYRRYSDSTLMSLTKREIIELLRVAEHNYFVTDEALDNSAKAGRELAEKLDKHGRWVWDSNAPHREHGAYKCSNCGYHSDFEENYCSNCGAKMDLKGGKSNE